MKSASTEPSHAISGFLLPVTTLWWREIVRFCRQRSRIGAALGSPLVFWLLLGSGFGKTFRTDSMQKGSGYLEYFFPGAVMMILLFTAIFSSISVIEERHEGFLLSVLVAPISRLSLVLGKVVGGATLALLQGTLFILLAPLLGISLSLIQWLSLLGVLFLIALTLTSLGFVCAWQLDSIQGFHAIMNLLLVPMWVLSGALFPATGASAWVRWIMILNPLTYSMMALRQVLFLRTSNEGWGIHSFSLSLGITCLFGLILILTACYLAQRQALKEIP
jgi:ABC-2 type transport system permease protein